MVDTKVVSTELSNPCENYAQVFVWMGVVLYYCDSGSTYRILIIHTCIADIPVQNFTCVIPKSQGQGSGCGRFEQQTFRTITHRSEIIYGRPCTTPMSIHV